MSASISDLEQHINKLKEIELIKQKRREALAQAMQGRVLAINNRIQQTNTILSNNGIEPLNNISKEDVESGLKNESLALEQKKAEAELKAKSEFDFIHKYENLLEMQKFLANLGALVEQGLDNYSTPNLKERINSLAFNHQINQAKIRELFGSNEIISRITRSSLERLQDRMELITQSLNRDLEANHDKYINLKRIDEIAGLTSSLGQEIQTLRENHENLALQTNNALQPETVEALGKGIAILRQFESEAIDNSDAKMKKFISDKIASINLMMTKEPIDLVKLNATNTALESMLHSLIEQVKSVRDSMAVLGMDSDEYKQVIKLMRLMPIEKRACVLSGGLNEVHELLARHSVFPHAAVYKKEEAAIEEQFAKAENLLKNIEKTALEGTDQSMIDFLSEKNATISALKSGNTVNLVALVKFNQDLALIDKTLGEEVNAVVKVAQNLLQKKRFKHGIDTKYDQIMDALRDMSIEHRATVLSGRKNQVQTALATKRYSFFGAKVSEDANGAINSKKAAGSYLKALDKAGLDENKVRFKK